MTETGSITAVLKLNTEPFDGNLRKVRENLTSFRNSMSRLGENSAKVTGGIQTLSQALSSLIPLLSTFDQLVAQTKSFNQFTKGLLNMSEAVANLSNVTNTSQVGMIRIKEIMNAWSQSARGLTVNLRTLRTEETAEQKILAQKTRMYKEAQMSLNQLYLGVNKYSAEMLKLSQSEAQERYQTAMLRKEWGLSGEKLVEVRAKLQQMEGAIVKFGNATVITSADLEKMAIAEKKVSATSTETSASLDRASASANRSATSMGRASTQASRLSKAFSSLKMIGTMVGSMLAYNFIHHLGQATNETIQSKSEMEGYFKMLHYGQTDIDKFNKALDQTAQRFQRINKYSLGETISSIGVEFDLTTDEMIKAMDVTSMITSEYLRAGRNANEASLAVKDVLQGQFQRLSRETGVKGEQLKEAGWSGDANDVEGLLDALRKVAEDRNWDVFATKANSLNDIVTILQNRFGEWSADMVNVVQPSIVGAFNSIMSFGQGLSSSLSGLWEWLNGDTWGATATKIGLVTTAILTLMPMLTAWRSGSKLIELASLSLRQQLTALIFGIKAETIAIKGSSSAIAMNILGIKEEEIAKINANLVQQGRILGLEAEEVAQVGLMDVIRAKILGVQAESIVTMEATEMNFGFVGSLYAIVTGEALAEAETLSLSGALAILTGTFLASPIGWFTLAILGLASAFYVLTGGLSDTWEKMKQFNETMRDTGSAQNEAHKWLLQYTEAHKDDTEAVKRANDEYEDYVHNLQSASYWYEHSQTAFNGLDLTAETTGKDILEKHGISKEQADEWNANLDLLTFGKKRYYKAEQVLNKQLKDEDSNYAKDLDSYLASVEKSGGDLGEAYDKMTSNYENLAMHSYIANTSDDWWEKSWNQLYAGMDQFWIDWDMFWADPQWSDAIDGLYHGLDMRFGITEILKAIGIDLEGQSVGDIITGWFNGIGEWFEGKSLMDIFGLDPNYDYLGEWFKSLSSSASSSIDWLFNDVINPTVWNAIMSIPVVSDIINLFMLISNDNIGAEEKGRAIGNWIGNGLITAIGQIPIVGDILRMLGLIPSTYSDASSKGKGVGDNIDSGVKGSAMATLKNWVVQEFTDALNGIGALGQQAYDTAKGWANQLWDGVNSVLQRHSPGFFHDEIKAEFGTDIPNAISSSSETAYSTAQSYAQSMYDGMNSASNTGFGLGGVVDDYKSDAQVVANSSEMMGSETTLAFNQMQLAVNDSTTQMEGNVATSYGAMQQKQTTLLNNMKASNTTAYNDMTTKSNQSLLQMRDSTSNITTQMTNAWTHMKDQIVATANKLKSDATTHFDSLSSNIGSFYRKIQNPANWGAGSSSLRQGARRPSVGRRVSSILKPSGYGGGNKWTGSTTMTVRALKSKICQNGDCSIFDGYDPNQVVNVQDFLGLIGQGHGFGWNNWNSTHYNHIKTTSDQWSMKSPQLLGHIDTNANFKVGEFNTGQPKISFASFQSMAESLFSAIPYKFYYDSSWKGSWLGAIQSGACNCYDGASALIAFANTCGFDGYMAHGSWDGIPHVWAVINGKKMDTTGWQQRGTWTPSASAGGLSSSRMRSYGGVDGGKTVNITIDMSDSTFYGMDDFKDQVRRASREVLQEEFNDPYTVTI